MLYILFFLGLALFLVSARSMVYLVIKEEAEPGDFNWELETALSQRKEEKPVIWEDSVQDDDLREKDEPVTDELEIEKAEEFGEKTDEVVWEIRNGRKEEEGGTEITQEEEIRQLHQRVYILSDQGKNGEAIARQLNLGKGEVELILGLRH